MNYSSQLGFFIFLDFFSPFIHRNLFELNGWMDGDKKRERW